MTKPIILTVCLLCFAALPSGAEVVYEYQYLGGEYSNGDTNLDFQVSADASDIVNGVTPTLGSGGFHSATIPSDTSERLATLTDGTWDSNSVTVIAADNAYPDKSLQIAWTFGTPQDIYTIVIFAGHNDDGSRAFINCKVDVTTIFGHYTLIDEARTGEYGKTPEAAACSYLRIRNDDYGAMVAGCQLLVIEFYAPTHNSLGVLKKYDDSSPPENNVPNQGTILKEIDVFNVATSTYLTPTSTPTATSTPEPIPVVYEGQYSARLQFTNTWMDGMDSGLDRDTYRIQDVTPGHDIRFSAWVRNATAGMNTDFNMRVADFNGATHLGDFGQSFTAADAWQQYVYDHTVSPDTTDMNAAFRLVTTSGGAIVIDDVEITDQTEGGISLDLTNGDFEDWPGEETSAPTDWRFFAVTGAVGEVRRLVQPTDTPTPLPTPTESSGAANWQSYR